MSVRDRRPSAGRGAPSGGARPLLDRTILREQVRDVLLERIVSGFYAPGSRLVETRIAEELGVSQAPVREALRDLEQLSLVVHESFRGCSVRPLSAADLLEAYPVRSALECLAARLAAPRIGPAEIARLEEFVEAMRVSGHEGDAGAGTGADADFHATIIQAAGNSVLTRQWEQLLPHARTRIALTLPASTHGDLADRHVPILEALRRGDPDAAEAAMAAHLAEVAGRVRRLISDSSGKDTP